MDTQGKEILIFSKKITFMKYLEDYASVRFSMDMMFVQTLCIHHMHLCLSSPIALHEHSLLLHPGLQLQLMMIFKTFGGTASWFVGIKNTLLGVGGIICVKLQFHLY